MPSITSWLRLEPRSRNDTIDAGLQARTAIRCGCWGGSGS